MERLSNRITSLCDQLYKTTQLRKKLEQRETQLMSELKKSAKEKEFDKNGYRFIKIIRRGSIEYTKVPELQSLNLEPYRKPDVSYWKLEYTGLELE
jgi:hypothetical protein